MHTRTLYFYTLLFSHFSHVVSPFFLAFVFSRFSFLLHRLIQFVGKQGKADGELNSPYDVACSTDGLLYAADTGNHSLQVVRADSAEFARKVETENSGQGQFSSTCGVCFDDDKGPVYVADGDSS